GPAGGPYPKRALVSAAPCRHPCRPAAEVRQLATPEQHRVKRHGSAARSNHMVIVMTKNAPKENLDRVLSEIKSLGFTPHISEGESRTLIGAIGPAPTEEVREHLGALPGVDTVMRITQPYKLA